MGGGHLHFHLHGLEHHDDVVGLHRLSRRNVHLDHHAGDGTAALLAAVRGSVDRTCGDRRDRKRRRRVADGRGRVGHIRVLALLVLKDFDFGLVGLPVDGDSKLQRVPTFLE